MASSAETTSEGTTTSEAATSEPIETGGGEFTLTSPDHEEGAKFDGEFTCNGGSLGGGIIPGLTWSNPPAGTMFYALTFIDTTIGEDSPMGQHWAAYDIPVATTMIEKGATSFEDGTVQIGPIGGGKFLAPCAQSLMGGMDDVYAFTLYALSAKLNVTTSSVKGVLDALDTVTPLGTAVLTGHAGLKGQ